MTIDIRKPAPGTRPVVAPQAPVVGAARQRVVAKHRRNVLVALGGGLLMGGALGGGFVWVNSVPTSALYSAKAPSPLACQVRTPPKLQGDYVVECKRPNGTIFTVSGSSMEMAMRSAQLDGGY